MYEPEIARFKSIHGYPLDLDNPKSFNQKIMHKKLFDRNPLLPITADKYRARNYIRSKLGYTTEAHLIPLLWVCQRPEDIPFDHFPDSYIIKPNNGAGRWVICNKGSFNINKHPVSRSLSRKEQIDVCKRWFHSVHGQADREWVYGEIAPLIIVEKLIQDRQGNIPWDYRFCMFAGKCKMIYVTNYEGIKQYFSFYDESWNKLNVRRELIGEPVAKPACFDEMLRAAEVLSKDFDFVRIDFFVADGYYYFSEITHYPGSGYSKITPTEFDFKLGEYWELH